VTVSYELPRFVIAQPAKGGATRYYWTLPGYYRKLRCTLHKQHETALGADFDAMAKKAAVLNGLFDEWDAARLGEPATSELGAAPGSVDWLFRTYKASNAWKEKVSKRTRPDHDRTIAILCNIVTKKGARIGGYNIKAITPKSADKLYEKIRDTPKRKGKTQRPRVAEKVVAIARKAWKVVRRLHPGLFDADVPNPWIGVEMTRRTKATKPAVTRDDVYAFAWGAIERGHAEAAAAAVICFEWLQRPENVLAGYVTWSGYRGVNAPNAILIEHHKTGEKVLHPLQAPGADGKPVLFYEEAEEVLAQLPKRGVSIVLRAYENGTVKAWDAMQMARLVKGLRAPLGLPDTFTLDACRHGGMTELEEAELTDGQGRALSGHRSKAYEGYAKRTERRALAATRKRHAHVLAMAVADGVTPAKNYEIPDQGEIAEQSQGEHHPKFG